MKGRARRDRRGRSEKCVRIKVREKQNTHGKAGKKRRSRRGGKSERMPAERK